MNASLKYAIVSYQKMLVVAKLIKGKNVAQTLALLDNSPKKAGKILSKVVKTAYNNVMTAEKNSEQYIVDQVVVGKGPKIKRMRFTSRARIHGYLKHRCYVSVQLSAHSK